jgi:putative serine protease PepD
VGLLGVALTVLVSMVAGGAIVGAVTVALDDDDGGAPAANVGEPLPASGEPADAGDGVAAAIDFTDLYERVRPSVVRITTGDVDESLFERDSDGLGSGVVVDADGHILTNFHVVRGFDEVTVTFSNGRTATAQVVGTDPGNDIAMVKVDADASDLQPATLGDSGELRVGSLVAALGNPFGLDGTFTTGIISGINRSLPSSANGRPIRGLIQTDAAVNPGNSGGALFDAQGRVIGINTAIENPNGNGFAGVAYAVPINTPKRFLSQLVEGETIDHPRLGISGQALTAADAAEIGVAQGVAVLAVDSGSGADDAGLQQGDIIVEIDGVPMTAFESLADYIDSRDVGDEVTLSVQRDGERLELRAELKSWDSSA